MSVFDKPFLKGIKFIDIIDGHLFH